MTTPKEAKVALEARVVNIRKERYDIYIGRAGKGKDGYFGNPVKVGGRCPFCSAIHATAGSTIECYRVYFSRRLANDAMFLEMVKTLKGKKLGCFCKPNPCHGDVIVEYLNGEK